MERPLSCTEMIILKLRNGVDIKDGSSSASRTWSEIIQSLKARPEARRVYWGLHQEEANLAHIHIVRDRLHEHYDFLASSDYTALKTRLQDLVEGELTIRHANIYDYTSPCESLGKGAPFTGTAIYKITDVAWDYAWQLWSTIVPKVKGCMGVAGGYIVEPVDGHEKCFIAWVGWATVEDHDAYHHTQHWRDRMTILRQGQKGYREYGHVVFENSPAPHL